MTINRGEQALPPQHRTSCDDASDSGDERCQERADHSICDEPSGTGAERRPVPGDSAPCDEPSDKGAERHRALIRRTNTGRHRSRLLTDLTVLVIALATPTVLVLSGHVGVAMLLAVAEFGAVIMRTWWSRPDGK